MSVFLGTWLRKPGEPDLANVMRIAVTNEGYDTSYTPYLEVSTPDDPAAACSPIEGTWDGPAATAIEFVVGEVDALIPAAIGQEIEYRAIVDFRKPGIHSRRGSDVDGTPWSFSVRRVA